MSRLILVSVDSHASAPLPAYRPYLEAKYHAALDEQIAAEQASLDRYHQIDSHDAETLEAIDEERAIRSGGRDGAHDPKRRLQEMDREGVVCELANDMTSDGRSVCIQPFCGRVSAPRSAELRQAGSRAFNRWLADMMAETDGRVLGVADPGPCLDIETAVAELEWAAAHGFVSVHVPGYVVDPALPRVFDRQHYERFWAACTDLGLVLNTHAGWGSPQIDIIRTLCDGLGFGFDFAEIAKMANKLFLENINSNYVSELGLNEATFIGGLTPQSREPFWQLMLGGVFDRHPSLKFAITELRADWLPATLAALDDYVAKNATPLELKPSEYFVRNCRVTPSFVHPAEIAIRHAIGVDQIMFGRDYPHCEGTWPNTWDWIRAAFVGVPEDEARLILGENAIDFYGLDRAKFTALAEKIGPRPEDLLGEHVVDSRKIDSFDKRGGYRKPLEQVDTEAVVRAFEADLELAKTTSG